MMDLLQKLNEHICKKAALIADMEESDKTVIVKILPKHIIQAVAELGLEDLIDWNKFQQQKEELEITNLKINPVFLQ